MEMRKIAREKRSPVQKSMEMRKIAREKHSHVQKSDATRKMHERFPSRLKVMY